VVSLHHDSKGSAAGKEINGLGGGKGDRTVPKSKMVGGKKCLCVCVCVCV